MDYHSGREAGFILRFLADSPIAGFLVPPWEGALRDRTEFGRSRKISVLPVFLTLLLVASLVAQKTPKPSSPKYDLQTEVKIKGTIEEVKLPPKGSEKEIVHLLVKNGAESADVYLCPKSFFDDMGMDFSKGDQISLTGSKVKQGEAELLLAREVVKENNTFVLRDAKGDPVWN
jgi:hypothetical protein